MTRSGTSTVGRIKEVLTTLTKGNNPRVRPSLTSLAGLIVLTGIVVLLAGGTSPDSPGAIRFGTGSESGAGGIDGAEEGAPGETGGAGGSSSKGTGLPGAGSVVGPGGIATGRGVTNSTITVGVFLVKGLTEVRQSFLGQCGNDCGDNRTQAKAAIDYINSQGGVANRKIVPVYHEEDAKEKYDVAAERACADFTEDHQVFAVMDLAGSGPWAEQLVACLAKHDTPRIGYAETDQKFADDYAPYFYAPSFLNLTRAGPIQVLGLLKHGFFDPGAKIALVRYDTPSSERSAEGIKKALSASSLKLTDEVAISYVTQVSDISVVAAQSSNAALRFRTLQISHVLIQDRRALTFIFMNSAESQGFRPRYGLTSFSQPQATVALAPAEQLKGAMAVGWLPATDVHPQHIPSPNSSKQKCIDVMKKAGLPSPELDEKGLSYCDDFFFFKTVGDNAKSLTTAGFQKAAEELGTGFEPLLTDRTVFGPRRHDGASAWRPLAFDDGCKCFRYVGGLEPIA